MGKTEQRGAKATARRKLKIVGIGASAGGLEAFSELLHHLKPKHGAAYVLVQHLDPTHPSLLSELLGRSTTLPVCEITPNLRVRRDHVYVIPPNCDLSIQNGVLLLSPRAQNAGPARSIDGFLRSLAEDQKENAIGVILSGAGSDGARGLEAIKRAGGVTFAQEESTSKYDSMPRSAIATGAVDFVLPPAKIAAEIARVVAQPGGARTRAAANARQRRTAEKRPAPRPSSGPPTDDAWPEQPADANLRKVFLLLRSRYGIDFALYRSNTMRRRLQRRLALHKLRDLDAYARMLRENPPELEALFQDLLISVTTFFRNPSVFDALQRSIFPRLVRTQSNGDGLRAWVAGCSTGQEAYSLAMAYQEFADRTNTRVPLQIFASDVNPAVLELARIGRYSAGQLENVSAARRQRFFVRDGDGWRVQKAVREMIVFAQQNLITDPPFTRVSLISCRNMLIYLEPVLQQRIIPTFHYALRPDGVLLLGTSESIGQFNNLFEPALKTHKIFVKKPAASWLRFERPPVAPALPRSRRAPGTVTLSTPELNVTDAFREADRVTLAKFAPAGVLVNEAGDVLQFRGDARRYFSLPAGKATLQLTKLAHDGLVLPLQRALARARKSSRPVRERHVRVDTRRGTVTLEVLPLRNLKTRCFLVLLAPEAPPPAAARAPATRPGRAAPDSARRIAELRRDLAETRSQFETLRLEHETSVEELQASNEEVQSANEELQSLNEELETSNEELESANEELTTLNEELATRNTELRESESRLREQAQLLELAPVLARSMKDRIIFWNRGAEKLYGFTREEAMGQTVHLFLGAEFPAPLEKIQQALLRSGRWEGEVWHRCKDGRRICVASQWVVHYDQERKPRAVLEVNADITARKEAERALRASEEFNRRILESTPDCVMVLDLDGRLTFINAGGEEAFGGGEEGATSGRYWPDFFAGEERSLAEKLLRLAAAGSVERFQGSCPAPRGAARWWDVVVRPVLGLDGKPEKLLAVARDVTDHKLAELAGREQAKLAALRADVAQALAQGGDASTVLQQVVDHLARHAGETAICIGVLDASGARLEPRASAGPAVWGSGRGADGLLTLLRHVAGSGEPYVTNAVLRDSALAGQADVRREKFTAFAAYPLQLEDRRLGVLALFARRRFDSAVLQEVKAAADAVAQFLDRRRSEEERITLLEQATRARNDALAASRAKDEFIASLSHELRTPLNPVLLLASDGAVNPDLPAETRAIFETILTNISLEARLIDDLLDLTRIAHGKIALQMKPLDVHTILRGAVGIVSADIEEKRIAVSLEFHAEPALIVGDAVRLHQAFWNVLINAIKFTPPGGRITIETAGAPAGDGIVIRFIDTGSGLSASDHNRIFKAFSQGENRVGGLGLGLAISRQLLAAHGGSISASSRGRGHGSTFEIVLPRASEPATAAYAADGHGSKDGNGKVASEPVHARRPGGGALDGRKRSVLVVEDHAPTRETLKGLLTRRQFDVTTAGTIAEALAAVERARPDLVISDLGLPDGDGCELWRRLRHVEPPLVGIALSGYGMEEDVARTRDAGFSEHLTKPVNIHALDRAIAALIERSSLAAAQEANAVDGAGRR